MRSSQDKIEDLENDGSKPIQLQWDNDYNTF
jgi:hypothetical protein